eukprot:4999618-Amphidinium_carterae.2
MDSGGPIGGACAAPLTHGSIQGACVCPWKCWKAGVKDESSCVLVATAANQDHIVPQVALSFCNCGGVVVQAVAALVSAFALTGLKSGLVLEGVTSLSHCAGRSGFPCGSCVASIESDVCVLYGSDVTASAAGSDDFKVFACRVLSIPWAHCSKCSSFCVNKVIFKAKSAASCLLVGGRRSHSAAGPEALPKSVSLLRGLPRFFASGASKQCPVGNPLSWSGADPVLDCVVRLLPCGCRRCTWLGLLWTALRQRRPLVERPIAPETLHGQPWRPPALCALRTGVLSGGRTECPADLQSACLLLPGQLRRAGHGAAYLHLT